MLDTGSLGKNKLNTIAMVCIATAMIMIIIRHCLLEFLVGSPLWANVQANISLMKNIFLGVKGATMISLFAVVMTDIKSKITDVGLWIVFIGVALLL
jgi:Na+-translocating ferredoxin:NAD+ oxidoreductase RnfD subunit